MPGTELPVVGHPLIGIGALARLAVTGTFVVGRMLRTGARQVGHALVGVGALAVLARRIVHCPLHSTSKQSG